MQHSWDGLTGFPGSRGWELWGMVTAPLFFTGNVKRLSKMYPKISKAHNAELRLRWCQIVLKNNLEAEYSKVKDFLHSQVCPWAVVAVPSSMPVGREGHRAFSARGKGAGSCF